MYKKKLNTTFNGKEYEITHEIGGWSGKNTVTVNGDEVEGLGRGYNPYGETRLPITLDGTCVQLVINGGTLSLATDNQMIEPQKSIVKGKKPPWWAYIFVLICVALLMTGGAIGGGLGAGSGFFCLIYSNKREKSVASRVLTCLGVSVGAWIVFIIIGVLLYG